MKLNKHPIPIYGPRTVMLALEFGMLLSEVAKEKGEVMTPELTQRAEKIFLNEIKLNGFKGTALNFTPLILASFEK